MKPYGDRNVNPSLRTMLREFTQTLRDNGDMSWTEIYAAGESLLRKKTDQHLDGLFNPPLLLATATLDDAIGQGLRMIELFSAAAGLDVIPLGLMQSPERIISECKRLSPDMLGLTILQYDTEELLEDMIAHIPDSIRVIAGGPIFRNRSVDDLKEKQYRVLNDVPAYLEYLLSLSA